jgi:hypothetical protein
MSGANGSYRSWMHGWRSFVDPDQTKRHRLVTMVWPNPAPPGPSTDDAPVLSQPPEHLRPDDALHCGQSFRLEIRPAQRP